MWLPIVPTDLQIMPAGKYIAPKGIKVISASVQNVITCKYIAPTGMKVVSASVQNFFACKYIAHMGIDIVSVVVQIVPTGKNLPHRLEIREFNWPSMVDLFPPCKSSKSFDKSLRIYITKI